MTPPIRPRREGPRARQALAAEAGPRSRVAIARCRDRTGKDRKKIAEVPPFFREPSGRATPARALNCSHGRWPRVALHHHIWDALTASAEGEGKLSEFWDRILDPLVPPNAGSERCPARGVPWVPGLSALASLALMAGLSGATWRRLMMWMAIGLVIYFAYGYRHSKARRNLAITGPPSSPTGR